MNRNNDSGVNMLVVAGWVASFILLMTVTNMVNAEDDTEPETVEETVVEEAVVYVPVKEDYQVMAEKCYEYLKERNIGVYKYDSPEFADGYELTYDDTVYADSPIYFANSILMRFVSGGKVVYSLLANTDFVLSTENFSNYDVSDSELIKSLNNFMQPVLMGKGPAMSDTSGYVASGRLNSLLAYDVTVNKAKLVCALEGKTDLDLGYSNRVLLQYDTEVGYITVILKLDSDAVIIDIDLL